jgi:GTP:adenosylcobinamide-phosphate guanylyltransferase
VHAIILAGQVNQGALREVSPSQYEAEIRVAGRPMVDYVVDAIKGIHGIEQIVVVGPEPVWREGTVLAPMGTDLVGNLLSGINTLSDATSPALVVTADIPLITTQILETFLAQAPKNVDVVYPIIEKSLTQTTYPTTERTYVRLKDGSFTGGNIFLINPAKFLAIRDQIKVFLGHRKSPIRLAKDIGIKTLIRFALGRLTIQDAEMRIAKLLNVKGRALIFSYPEVGVDVDKPQDLALVEQLLRT